MKWDAGHWFARSAILLIGTGAGYVLYGPDGAASFAVTFALLSLTSWSERYD